MNPLPNTTCDIYRTGVAPPTAPSVAAVDCYLYEDFYAGHVIQIGTASVRWTHVMLMKGTTDIRDGYTAETAALSGFDLVWVPDQNGTKFEVVFVVRLSIKCTTECKKVYLRRVGPTWPTDYL